MQESGSSARSKASSHGLRNMSLDELKNMSIDEELEAAASVTVSMHRADADFSSIRDALLAQPPGKKCCVMVDGGRYDEGCLDLREGICIKAMPGCEPASSRPVIICSGSLGLGGIGGPCFRSQVAGARIEGLRIDHGGSNSAACVEVKAGDLFMDGCVITGFARIGVLVSGSSCPILQDCKVEHIDGDGIKVSDTAAPRVLKCEIHDNAGFGIYCSDSSAGEFADCDIYANCNAGVKTRGTTAGIFRGNKVHSGQQGGFWIEESSVCELVENEIFQNQKSGIQVGGKADPKVVKNIIRDGFKGGIVVHDFACGSFLQNEISTNAMAGVGGTDSACPMFHSNLVRDGKGGGIVLHAQCRGVFMKNRIIRNSHAGIGLKGKSDALFDGNIVSDGTGYGIWIQETAMNTLQNNVVERNARAGIIVTNDANPTISYNILRDGKHAGLLIRHNAKGTFRHNTMSRNAHGNIIVLENVSSQIVSNNLTHGPLGGIIIRGSSTVTVRGNTISQNDGANIAVLDKANPVCDGNVCSGTSGRGLVIMDEARGLYRFNMFRNSELSGIYVGKSSSPQVMANCICDGKAAGILLEDDASGIFTYNIVCSNQNEGVAVNGSAHPNFECNVVLQGGHGCIWLDENASGTFKGNVVEDSGSNAYRCGTATANEWRLAERNTNTAPAALAASLSEWAETKLSAPGGGKKVVLVQNPDQSNPERGGVMATQCSELLGLDPARSCRIVARFLGDAGQFEDAEELIQVTQDFLGEAGPFKMGSAARQQLRGDTNLHCAELLNTWAASSKEYSKHLMVRGAQYAKEAANIFAVIRPADRGAVNSFASSLYWCALNFATLCRLGGGGKWSTADASEASAEAIRVAQSMVTEDTPHERMGELHFAQGVLSFCRSESIVAGHLPDDERDGSKLHHELLKHALSMFELAYTRWCHAYGEKSLQTVKAITMIAVLKNKIEGEGAGFEWKRKELRIREELQGEVHPRTQQARRTFADMVEEELKRGKDVEQIAAQNVGDLEERAIAAEMAHILKGTPMPTRMNSPPRQGTLEYLRWGQMCLHCAEVLNKWAASSPAYTEDIMTRAADYSINAVSVFSNYTPRTEEILLKKSQGLYWMGLNFATLCRLGGGGRWTSQQAYDISTSSLADCRAMRETASDDLKADAIFAQGVLAFCKAEAVLAGFLKSTKMEQEVLAERKFMQALQLFEHANQLWASVFGEKHLETVKAITMIGKLLHRMQGAQAGLEWYRKELKIREELQGEMHPRTQQARRVYTALLDAKLEAERRGNQ